VLALLSHIGADRVLDLLLAPVTQWWLGLPVVLGVPLLFGILRKELSLLMVFQALGTFEIDRYLGASQIFTLLLFLTFYLPCISTFAVMLKAIGRREAIFAASLSLAVALLISGVARIALAAIEWLVT
jgi:ferrous iron transport protein B